MLKKCSLLMVMLPMLVAADPALPQKIDDFALLDHAGTFHQLTRNQDVPIVVLYAFTTGCPIVRQNVSELEKIARDYAERGVRIAAIDGSIADDSDSITQELLELKVNLRVLVDSSQVISEDLGITRTGEALVIKTKEMSIVWRGPIDDRVGYNAQKPTATRHYLREAIDAVLTNKAPPNDAPQAKGCLITFQQPREKHELDYAQDIAPIIQNNCRECHQKGGIAPWSMDSYKQVAGRGTMMREVIRTRLMPPWDADPAHGKFANDKSLTPAEQRAVIHWVEQGCKPSNTDPLATTSAPKQAEWPLGKPDFIVELPPQDIPATGTLPYRKPTLTINLPADTWIRAVDLRPSEPQWMHHAFAFDAATELEDEFGDDPRFQRLKDFLKGRPIPPEMEKRLERRPRGLTTFFASYVPGLEPAFFPEGTGKFLKKETTLTFQLHYTTNGKAGTDRPRLGLYFAKKDKPDTELKVTSAFQLRLQIPPNERNVPASAERTFSKPITMYAVSPHMHYRGSSMRYTAVYPDGKKEVLISVPKYDLDWQRTYIFKEPKIFPANTKIQVEGVFDNSAMNPDNPDPSKMVRFGNQSWDEMFIGYMVYSELKP